MEPLPETFFAVTPTLTVADLITWGLPIDSEDISFNFNDAVRDHMMKKRKRNT